MKKIDNPCSYEKYKEFKKDNKLLIRDYNPKYKMMINHLPYTKKHILYVLKYINRVLNRLPMEIRKSIIYRILKWENQEVIRKYYNL